MKLKMCVFGVIVLITTLLTSCTEPTQQDILLDVQKYINSIVNYYAEVDILYTQNTHTDRYKAKHWYCFPDKYRIEITHPEVLKGKLTICDGEKISIYHPYIDEKYVIDEIGHQSKMLFIGSFVQHFMNTEQVDIRLIETGQNKYAVLECIVPGNNKNFNRQILWVDVKNHTVNKLEIVNQKGESVVTIAYNNMQVNVDMDDKLFDLDDYKSHDNQVNQDVDLSVKEVEQIAGFKIALPSYLPQGIYMKSINCITGVNNNIVVINYGDCDKTIFTITEYKQDAIPAIAVNNVKQDNTSYVRNLGDICIEIKSQEKIGYLPQIIESIK